MDPAAGTEKRRSAAGQVFVEQLERPTLDAGQGHHLARVLRLRPGERVVAADGRGHWRSCRFGFQPAGEADPSGDGGRVQLDPDGDVSFEPAATPKLVVAFAPTKGDRPEWVVQKLTECGVDGIVVLACDRSVVRWAEGRAERAMERLREVSRQAAAQSRRVWLPVVSGVSRLEDLPGIGAPDPGRPSDDHRRADPPGARGSTGVVLAEPGGGPVTLDQPVVAIGPEGGWSSRELGLGFPTVGLGDGVLRAETAALAAGVLLAALRAGTVETTMTRAAG